MAMATEYMRVRSWMTPWCAPMGSNTIRGRTTQKTVAQHPDSGCPLISMIPVDSDKFWCGANANRSSIKFPFHSYKEHPKQTPYMWTSLFVRAAPGLRGGLELELLFGPPPGDSNWSVEPPYWLGHLLDSSFSIPCANHGCMYECHVLIKYILVS